MTYTTVDATFVIDTFLLLLIGIGPKLALVPFLEVTQTIRSDARGALVRTMLLTAGVVALVLLALGELLSRLLHFSTGSLSIAGGIILVVIAVTMVLGTAGPDQGAAVAGREPARVAVFPLAVPYLLNPAGIVTLVTLSAEADGAGVIGVVIGLLIVVLGLDLVVFRWANRLGEHLDESRMLVTEKVFGVLLAALAVQLVLDGMHSVGLVPHLTGH